jgi:ferredoxin--NADP+ reductase
MGVIDSLKNIFSEGAGKQDFLEADPYWDQSNIPVNTYKNKAPFTGKIVSTKRIVGAAATGETCDIVMSHDGEPSDPAGPEKKNPDSRIAHTLYPLQPPS